MRKNTAAQLIIRCPICGNDVNEYNWTLDTAASYSNAENTCPTFLYILIEIIEKRESVEKYTVRCPRCSEGVKLELLKIPEKDKLLEYLEEVGEDYYKHRY